MTDNHTPEQRSANMAHIRSSGTKPEEQLYQSIRVALGYRWRIDRNVTSIRGNPDVVVPSLRLIIFVDGCFFHGCSTHYREPMSNREYWLPKIAGNIARDKTQRGILESQGWRVWQVWEHELRKKSLAETELILGGLLQELIAKHRGRLYPAGNQTCRRNRRNLLRGRDA
jgi:DNA mismatch endonuclease, patch repair protein